MDDRRTQELHALIDEWPVTHAAVGAARRDAAGHTNPAVIHGDDALGFELASVTKLLTATAVLVACEEEIVGLDDAVDGVAGATVRHLLAHASGLGPDGQVLAPPGTRRIYSNAGFDLLGEIVTRASGLPFATYLTEAVLTPLGMHATRLDGSPASGAVSTVADLRRFAAELLAPDLLATSTVATASTVAFPGLAGVLPGYGRQAPNDWGLGFELRATKSPHWTGERNSPATFGHFGRAGTFLWVDPVAGVALVCLTDRPFGARALPRWPALSDAVLAAG
ncbi:MAG TPA: serine hydrolase domain-containing protein [Acidimicrobiales bacterium]|jgi:CubicO group peptidase (beta-lactamase class C family)|nr:serine hydrolase domain-containing protein [Acidimicrobiales bacterium]